ncbi:MAG: PIN domain-containing protein [Candidatus Sabulitectum sp.]|nr:PIN domain-containing protein [Candidatus Sabulitectum sp.]
MKKTMANKPTIYWDSCVLIALLKDENRPNGEMRGVYSWARKVSDGEAVLVLSSLARVEILKSFLRTDQERKFEDFLNRSNIMEIEMGPRVAEKARELRDHYQGQKQNSKKILCSEDAIHLATAIMYRADEFHTFDTNGKNRCLGLIPLSGSVAGYPLTICRPQAGGQQEMDLSILEA